jgi:hypothetical protein
VNFNTTSSQIIDNICKLFTRLTKSQKQQLITCLFKSHINESIGEESRDFVPKDFLGTITSAMANLKDNNKPNLIYYFGKSLEVPPNDRRSKMPIDRMPFGLISHNIMFFGSNDTTNLHPESHFVEWETTMFSHFGHKWAALQRGPMWSGIGETLNETTAAAAINRPTFSPTKNGKVKQYPISHNKENIKPAQVSTLWTGLNSDQLEELSGCGLSASASPSTSMAQLHNMSSSSAQKTKKYIQKNPVKVYNFISCYY